MDREGLEKQSFNGKKVARQQLILIVRHQVTPTLGCLPFR